MNGYNDYNNGYYNNNDYYNNNYYNDYDYYDDYNDDYNQNYNDYIKLNLFLRILAKVIDLFVFIIVHYLLVSIYSYYFLQKLETKYILLGLIICLILNSIVEFLIIPSIIFKGQSVGKKIMKIKTIKKNGYSVSFLDILVEYIFLFLIPIDVIYCLRNEEFLHNKTCSTFVKKIK